MNVIEHKEDLVIIGLALPTTPERAAAEIPAHWQRFFASGLLNTLPQRSEDSAIYAVYCDYGSDDRGSYTMVIGVSVSREAEIPEGLRRVRIPHGKYARFFAEGDPSQVIWKTWAEINGPSERRQERRFIADYERYAEMSASTVKAEIAVGLS